MPQRSSCHEKEGTVRSKLTALLILACSSTLAAQGRDGLGPAQQASPADSAPIDRANLEQQVRERIAKVMKERLAATDEQMLKLEATNRKYDEKRRILVDQERDIRMSLRDEMLRPDDARQPQVAALLDRVIKVQRQRVDIAEQEQNELAAFLTPLQRAKYFGLEQQVRQRMNQMRQALLRNGRGAFGGRGGRMGRGQPQRMGQQQPGRGRGLQPPPPPQ